MSNRQLCHEVGGPEAEHVQDDVFTEAAVEAHADTPEVLAQQRLPSPAVEAAATLPVHVLSVSGTR